MDAKREYAEEEKGMPYHFGLVAFLEREDDSIGLFRMWVDAAALWHVLRALLVVAII
jgi:hypothetical protein